MIFDITLRMILLITFSFTGFIFGRNLKLRAYDIASLLVFVISPVVIFVSISQSPISLKHIPYAGYAFLFSSFSALLAFVVAKFFWSDVRVNLFAFAGGTGNTGYFALPIVFSLFNQEQITIAIFIVIGVNLYEFTIGYFLSASGQASVHESIRKVSRMPVLYAALLAITFKAMNIPVNGILLNSLDNFKGAYSVLGMMVIGISLSTYKKLEVDYLFTSLLLLWKHIAMPIAGILLFSYVIPLNMQTLEVVTLMVATPMAGNVVVISSQLNIHPEKAAISVMLSTSLTVFMIPIITWYITR
ncbi:AEC family transporter [Enterobacter mori]|uniref:AEC family transporter n=1 Tax=Enterobacter mori TaxID=539813 RepID=UPI002ED0A4C7|nr:AEC family transporter [Enterobacter mori]